MIMAIWWIILDGKWQRKKKDNLCYWHNILRCLSNTFSEILNRIITNFCSKKTLPPPPSVPRNMIFTVDSKTGQFVP